MILSETLRSLTRFSSRRPTITLLVTMVLALGCVLLTLLKLEFKTARSDLIDPNASFQQRWLNYTESFGQSADIVVVVEAGDPATIKQVIDEMGARLEQDTDLFENILYKIEPGRLRGKGLQYLQPEQLEYGLARLEEYRPILDGNWDLTRVVSVVRRLSLQIEDRQRLGLQSERAALVDHAGLLSASLSQFIKDRNEFQSPWPDILPVDPRMRDAGQEVHYLINDAGTMGFIKAVPAVHPGDMYGPTKAVDRLRALISEVAPMYSGVQIGLTGIPVLENDEMRKSQEDMINASLISVFGVGLVLFLGFRGFRHPFLALLMLAVGMAWAFGYTTIFVGHLNILSISFAVILIGLGIDFAIHYLNRYLELRHEGLTLRSALLETSAGMGAGIVTAAVTTSLAFFCAAFTSFLGVAELGIIAGGGILLCAMATFVVLPAMVSLADQNVAPRKLPTPFEGSSLRLLTTRFPWLVCLASLMIIGWFAQLAVRIEDDGHPALNIRYDYNLLNLQADKLESVEIQKRIFQEAQGSLLFAVSVADSPAEARRLRAEFEALPTVHHVDELGSQLPEPPSTETQLFVQAFAAQLQNVRHKPPQLQFDNADPANVGKALERLLAALNPDNGPTESNAVANIDSFLDRFEVLPLPQQIAFLQQFQMRMSGALLGQFQALAAAADFEPVALADLPDELTSRFVSPAGKWLVQIYPSNEIWDIEPLTRFVEEVRSVDPEVTGTPLQNFEASQQIMDSYQTSAIYALIVICLVLLVDFLDNRNAALATLPPMAAILLVVAVQYYRKEPIELTITAAAFVGMIVAIAGILEFRAVRDTFLAMLPPLAGGVMMFGMLTILSVDLNPANLIVLPLILGIGVDDGVHVVHDFRMQKGRYRTSSSTMNAIVLTSLTSMIGFGSMMTAAHQGLYSLGLVLVIGVGSCLFVSLVPLPAVLTLISRRQNRTSRPARVPEPAQADAASAAGTATVG